MRKALLPILMFVACVDPRATPLGRDGGGDADELPADGPAPAVVPDAPAARPPDAPEADLASVTPAPDAGGTGGSGGSGGSPDAGCKAGQHQCPDGCKLDYDIQACGQSCTPCPTIANGDPSCDGSKCGFSCRPEYHLCGGKACLSNDDVGSCGRNCEPCPTDPNGVAACVNGRCTLSCGNGTLNCQVRCIRPGWGFENGDEGAELQTGNSKNADPPKASTARAHTGHGSLAQPIRSGTGLYVEIPVCGVEPNLHATNLNQKTVSFWYFYDGPDPAPGNAHISVSVGNGYFPEPTFAVRQWTKASLLLDGQQFATVSRIGYSYFGGDLPGPGTLYIDDFDVQ